MEDKEKVGKEIQESNKLHQALLNTYNNQLEALKGKLRKRTYIYGAVGIGVGALSPKIYILGKWIFSIIF